MTAKYSDEIKAQAEELYYLGYLVPRIVEKLGINNVRIVFKWAERGGWDKYATPERVIATLSRRIIWLTEKEDKTGSDLQESERLSIQLERFLNVKNRKTEVSANSREAKASNKKLKNNDTSEITKEQLEAFIDEHFYEYQNIIYQAGLNVLTSAMRMILKPRQAGGTWGLAVEAFYDAVVKGESTAFISATKRQAEVFKTYIITIARTYFNVTLTGSPIRLANGAEIHFLSPNSNAQSFCANVVYDEFFWTAQFSKMEDVAGAMSTRGDLKTTFVSTPSSISHDAYEYWDGTRFNKHQSDDKKVHIGITTKEDFAQLRTGRLDPDGIWRMRFTIWDAWNMGLPKEGKDGVRLEKLRIKYPDKNTFACLFECTFIDDTASVFSLPEILACAVERESWKDIDFNSSRPFGMGEVTAGYEPAGTGDNSSYLMMTRPYSKQEKFRLLENNNWRGIPANDQCDLVSQSLQRYNVTYMEIDNTGPGNFLGDFVVNIFPDVVRRNYSVEGKTKLVLHGKKIIADKRFEYDADMENNRTLPLAFMSIKQKVTPHSNQITYYSTRTKKGGHGDAAWGALECFQCESPFAEFEREASITIYN